MFATEATITPLALSYGDLLVELATGSASIGMLHRAIFFLDCVQDFCFDEATAMQKLNTVQKLTAIQKRRVHRLFCNTVRTAVEQGRASWRSGPEGSWGELNHLLELNGLTAIPVPFVDNMPVMRHYSPAAVALAVSRQKLPYLVFPYQTICV